MIAVATVRSQYGTQVVGSSADLDGLQQLEYCALRSGVSKCETTYLVGLCSLLPSLLLAVNGEKFVSRRIRTQ